MYLQIRLRPGAQLKDGKVMLRPSNCEDVRQKEATVAEATQLYESMLKRILGYVATLP